MENIDPRPRILRWRDVTAAVLSGVLTVLVVGGWVDHAALVAILDHHLWEVLIALLGTTGVFAWLDHRFGQDVGAKLQAVGQGALDSRDAARELAAPPWGVPKPRGEEPTPIVDLVDRE